MYISVLPCVCVLMCVFGGVRFLCVCMYNIYVCMYVSVCMFMCVCKHVFVCVDMYICMHVYWCMHLEGGLGKK